jgi:hypothetical protein
MLRARGRSANGMVRPCSSPASEGGWLGAPKTNGGSVFPARANTGDPNGPFEAYPLITSQALISMMVRSNDELQSETGYIDARPHHTDRRNLLALHGRTIHRGHERPWGTFLCLSAYPLKTDSSRTSHYVAKVPILLQKSEVAGRPIFGENTRREAITDSYGLSRITEVACEFSVRRRGPSHLYPKAAPTGRRIFEPRLKSTFATKSAIRRHQVGTRRNRDGATEEARAQCTTAERRKRRAWREAPVTQLLVRLHCLVT